MNKENLRKMVTSIWFGIAIFVLMVVLAVLLAEHAFNSLNKNDNEGKCTEEVERIGSVIEDKEALIDRMIVEKEKCGCSYIDDIDGGM